ncbi:cation-translocating P-type ATPase [Desulfocurvibacter africanus]|uniref:ATPase, P-type (Transporting), HAD superfamily, subfamily IC n=1 Tax=Desulfocurvibacter africanus subsp. africanus str. Walvis Bay TaxID=690850 RepID=F3YVF0_DESAF|nr:cation-transporting P-type ATPase [Desulfocurvibacter africanus]EGJ48542.1 ATPase, P-type (transporting), HAD superfamily, subfamily IC [Desulfocurvibacter africanus subsp. africanus str. Walvis Bay]
MADKPHERGANDGPEAAIQQPWARAAKEVLDELGVDPGQGLGQGDIGPLLEQYGENRLAARRKRSAWNILLDQLKNLVVALLAGAAVVSYIFGEWPEAVAILIALGINVFIGFFTELQATRSMEALQRMSGTKARVLRGGSAKEIPAVELVPGDILVLESGDVVAADARIVESNRLQADESALTGESVPVGKSVKPVEKDAPMAELTNMLFKGTALTVGSGKAVVTATGVRTELGHIAEMAEAAKGEETPLEKRLNALGQRLFWVVLLVAAAVMVNGYLVGMETYLLITTAVALAVAAIPEGLPIVATVALARGMWRMNARNALINRLSAVETLGSTSVIFTDKTGTLTENRMHLQRVAVTGQSGIAEIPLDGKDSSGSGDPAGSSDSPAFKRMLEVGVLCNNAQIGGEDKASVGDPLEIALLQAGKTKGINRKELLEAKPEVREDAFDPERALMATWHKEGDGFLVAVKGTPESVLEASTRVLGPDGEQDLTDDARDEWRRKNSEMAAQGLRVLGSAMKRTGDEHDDSYEDLTFLGLYGLMDPPRKGVDKAIEKLRRAGIKVVMVTGDQPMTAKSIGETLKLSNGQRPMEGKELGDPDKLSESKRKELRDTTIFSRVTPEQKLNLIALYQKTGAVVAMTGDGVNDAPALKKADIGVAMGLRGTQVAREAADMVLKDDAFQTIVAAVEQGRVIFSNIRKFLIYLLSGNIGGIIIVGTAILVGLPLPLLPLQILFINMLFDVFPALALGVGEGDPMVMDAPPRKPGEHLVAGRHWALAGAYGLLIAVCVLAAFWLALNRYGLDESQAVTVSFLTLTFARMLHTFNMRDPGPHVVVNEVTSNPFVWAALGLCGALIAAALFVPSLAEILRVHEPGRTGWTLILAGSFTPFVVIQLGKALLGLRSREHRTQAA